jgi:membrane associated rhomboid family serine protease
MFSLQPVTLLLILVNIGVYLLQLGMPEHMVMNYALWPVGSGLVEPWQVISYGFLHTSPTHLAFNMLALFMFGAEVEHELGSLKYLLYYFVCVLVAALVQQAVTIMHVSQAGYTLGASGGVFGLLLAFAVLFPHARLVLLFPPIPMEARWFVLAYAGLELYFGVTGTAAGVAHFAHLGGMLTGWLLLRSRRRRY